MTHRRCIHIYTHPPPSRRRPGYGSRPEHRRALSTVNPLDDASGIHSQNTIFNHYAPNHLLFLYIKVTCRGIKRQTVAPSPLIIFFYLLLRCGDDTSHRCKDVPTHQYRCKITQKGLKASRSDGAPPHHPNTSSLILSLQYQYNILTLFITN